MVLDVKNNLKFRTKLEYLMPYFGIKSFMTAIFPNFEKAYDLLDCNGITIGKWVIWSINENVNDSGCENYINSESDCIVETKPSGFHPQRGLVEPDLRVVFSKTKEGYWIFRGAFKVDPNSPTFEGDRYRSYYHRVSSIINITGTHPNISLSLISDVQLIRNQTQKKRRPVEHLGYKTDRRNPNLRRNTNNQLQDTVNWNECETKDERESLQEIRLRLNELKTHREIKPHTEYELRAGYNEVKEKSFYNCDRIIDSFGQRWVKCKCCGKIKPDFDFIEFGGQKSINFGICEECAKRNR